MNKRKKIWLAALGVFVVIGLENCVFREFPDHFPIEVRGRIMATPDSALANAEFWLSQFYSNMYGEQMVSLASGTTDENGRFSVIYTANSRKYKSTVCDITREEIEEAWLGRRERLHGSGLSLFAMRVPTDRFSTTVFTCHPTNIDMEGVWYMSSAAEFTVRLTNPLEEDDTLFIDYAPADTTDPRSFFIEQDSTRCFFMVGPVDTTDRVTFLTNMKNPVYEGRFENRRGGDVYRWGVGMDAFRNAPLDTVRPRGLPFADTLNIEN